MSTKPQPAELLQFQDLVKSEIKNSKLVCSGKNEVFGKTLRLRFVIEPSDFETIMTNPEYIKATAQAMIRWLGNDNALKFTNKISIEFINERDHMGEVLIWCLTTIDK